MSGLATIASVGSGAWRRISGLLAGFPGSGRMSELGRMSGACRHLAAGRLLWAMLQGPDVRGHGRMSEAWEVFLTPSVGSIHT